MYKKSSRTDNSYAINNEIVNDLGDGGDFDDEDLTPVAYLERQRGLSSGGNQNTRELQKVSMGLFSTFLQEKIDANLLTDANVQIELIKEAERLEIKDKAALVLAMHLLTKDNILADIKQHCKLFLRFCHENPKAQKYLLGGFEKLVGDVYKDKLFGKSIEILKLLYDEDILEEGVIIDWANRPSKKYITKEISKKLHEKVEPFINWLKNAKEESDDDEKLTTANDNETTISNDKNNKDSLEFRHRDEEDFLEFSHRVSRIELVDKERHQKNGSETNLTNGDDDDDLDIDNI
jgi:translation initiation factor 5